MQEIVQRFAEEGYMIDPEALELIASYTGPREELVEGVISGLDRSTLVVGAPEVRCCPRWTVVAGDDGGSPRRMPSDLKRHNPVRRPPSEQSIPSPPPSPAGPPTPPSSAIPSPRTGASVTFEPPGDLEVPHSAAAARSEAVSPLRWDGALPQAPISSSLEGLTDITGRSTCVGEYRDFVRYFRDRYSKIREILSGRMNARPIESLRRGVGGREISIIGMVMDVRTSAKGNLVVELEDPTGTVTAIFSKGAPGSEEVGTVVPDEVIGVTGTTDGKGRFFAKALVRPDLQARSSIATGEGGALLLSDVHVGSTYFMEEAWERFIGWIRGEADDPLGIASNVRYAVIAGDLVDGIGIYPGQEGDLAIKDVMEQYGRAAELLSEIPERIKIILSPGNHDMVRQAEPQPGLPDSLRDLFKKNVTFVGNPAAFRLGGVEWLVYHGRSIDDLVPKIPGLSYAEPQKAMVEMLKRRHLSPIYGNRVSIAPEVEDHLVIQRQPAILHCGHVHTVGMTRYKGVTAINSGTWQGQTDFQKKMNIQPTPAIVPYIDLSTMRARRLIFD
jgi:DNA polymerase II small subunit